MRYPAIIIFVFFNLTAGAQGFLKARGTAIVDGGGNEIILRDMGPGGWLPATVSTSTTLNSSVQVIQQ